MEWVSEREREKVKEKKYKSEKAKFIDRLFLLSSRMREDEEIICYASLASQAFSRSEGEKETRLQHTRKKECTELNTSNNKNNENDNIKWSNI